MSLVPGQVKCSPLLASPEPTPSLGVSTVSFPWLSWWQAQGSVCLCHPCGDTAEGSLFMGSIDINSVAHSGISTTPEISLLSSNWENPQTTKNEELKVGEISVGENVQYSGCVFQYFLVQSALQTHIKIYSLTGYLEDKQRQLRYPFCTEELRVQQRD